MVPEIELSALKLGFPSSTTPCLLLIQPLSFSSRSYPQFIHFYTFLVLLVVVQLLSCVWLFVTPWTAALQAPLSFTFSRSLLRFMSIVSVMPSNHLTLCCPNYPPALNLSHHQGPFQWVSSLHQVAEVLELQHQSCQWIFRVDFL